MVAEWRYGQTLGKHLFGLRVVQESGAQISLGQSIVRQLPAFLQVYWIDALFALFTDKRQRAFEMLSKTRVGGRGVRVTARAGLLTRRKGGRESKISGLSETQGL